MTTMGRDDGAQPHSHDQVHDLHDCVIQQLFGVGLRLQSTLGAVDDPAVRARLTESLIMLDAVIDEVRAALPARSGRQPTTGRGDLDDLSRPLW
jgi:hypothetical protein